MSPSAYPGRYPGHLLLRQSCQHCACGWTPCSQYRPPERASMLVPSFLIVVLRRLRRILFTGFNGSEPWSFRLRQVPILSHFGQANNPRRLVSSYGESMYFACAFHNDLHASVSCWVQVLLCALPASAVLRVSRHPGEEAVPRSQRVGNRLAPHPTSTIKLSKSKTLPCIPRIATVVT